MLSILSVFNHFLYYKGNKCSRFDQANSISMFVQLCVIQRQRLINTRTLTNGDSDVPAKGGSRRGVENGLSGAERGARQDEAGNETENEDNENNENDEEEEEEEGEGPFVPHQCPGSCRRCIRVNVSVSLLFIEIVERLLKYNLLSSQE